MILQDVRHGPVRSRLRLLAPLRYLQIWHPEKTRYDFAYPAVLGLATWIAYMLLAPQLPLFGENGLIRYARDILIMAVPFMVGALAAVAMGMPGQHIDRRPPGAELILDHRALTLRQFVCYLLGYLCFVALITLLLTIAAPLLRDTILTATSQHTTIKNLLHAAGTCCLFLLLSTLVVTILWALYFLTDIINRPARVDSSTS